jgi:hypothetical protein
MYYYNIMHYFEKVLGGPGESRETFGGVVKSDVG